MIRNHFTTFARLPEPALLAYLRRNAPVSDARGRSVVIDLMRKRRP
jgi:hypothetical protein